jgi:hypothetical protein
VVVVVVVVVHAWTAVASCHGGGGGGRARARGRHNDGGEDIRLALRVVVRARPVIVVVWDTGVTQGGGDEMCVKRDSGSWYGCFAQVQRGPGDPAPKDRNHVW